MEVVESVESSRSEQRETIEHLDGSVTEYSYFEPSAASMNDLVKILFEQHWREVVVRPCIERSVFRSRVQRNAEADNARWLSDGKSGTVAFPFVHSRTPRESFPRTGAQAASCARGAIRDPWPALRWRQEWGVRMWNGFGEQMTTVFLPNPCLSDEMKPLREPNWDRLKLWYELRHQFLGEQPPASIAQAQTASNFASSENAEH